MFISPKAIRSLNLRSSWPVLLMTLACLALFQWTFFASVELVGSSIASIVSAAVAPLAADGIGSFRRSITLSRRWRVSVVFSMIGLLLPLLNGASIWGMVMAAVSGISYAVYTIAAARLERTSSGAEGAGIAATALAFVGAAIALMPAARPNLGLIVSVRVLFIALYLGFCATALAYVLYVRGLRYIAPSSALSAAFIQPFAVMAFARVVLHEHLDRFALVAVAIFSLSVLLRFRPTNPPRSEPEHP